MDKIDLKKVIIAVIAFLFFSEIFRNWDHFKAGLFGHAPVKTEITSPCD